MGCCDSNDVKSIVKDKYGKIAREGQQDGGCNCNCSTNEELSVFKDDYSGIEGYVPEADLNLGCGLPTEYAGIKAGDTVIDLGSGAGNDCFVARRTVGDEGQVIGVDMTPEMIERAKDNVQKLGYTNIKFRLGEIENLPVTANKADVVISNCVINLVPDKYMAFNEIMRVLKPGGHFCISDVVTKGSIPADLLKQAELYAGCIAGALPIEEYIDVIHQTGFKHIDIKKKKAIEIPDSLMEEFLTTEQLESFKSSGVGIFSITVTAEKPSCLCGCDC